MLLAYRPLCSKTLHYRKKDLVWSYSKAIQIFWSWSYEEVREKIATHELEPVSKFAIIQSTKDFGHKQ